MWLILFLLLLPSATFAQESTDSATIPTITADSSSISATATPKDSSPPPPYLQYQQDYIYQYDLYQQAYLKYIDKRDVYTKYGTITTQKEKFTAAIDAINARNLTLRTYLTALRTMLDEYQSANPTATESDKIELSKWEAWFEEQLIIVPAINNQIDLTRWIDSFKEKYLIIQKVIYTALVQHEVNLRTTTLNLLHQTADEIRSNPNLQPENQNWLNTLTIKSDLVSSSLNAALAYTTKKQSTNKFTNFYPSAKTDLTNANNYLREISADLKLTIIKFIKK